MAALTLQRPGSQAIMVRRREIRGRRRNAGGLLLLDAHVRGLANHDVCRACGTLSVPCWSRDFAHPVAAGIERAETHNPVVYSVVGIAFPPDFLPSLGNREARSS